MVQKAALYVARQVHVKATTATDYWYRRDQSRR